MPHNYKTSETGMLIYIDSAIYNEFKAKLLLENKKVQDVVKEFVYLYIGKEYEQNKRDSRKDEGYLGIKGLTK